MTDDTADLPTGIDLTPLNADFRERPHEILDRLRTREPVHRDRQFDRVFLTRFADIDRVLNDRRLAVDPRKSRAGSYARLVHGVDEKFRPTMLHMDDPDHRRLRRLVAQAFNPRAIEALRPRIAETANGLLDAIGDIRSFELIEAYARPLPTIVIAEMLGVGAAHRRDFMRWSDAQLQLFNPNRTQEQKWVFQQGVEALNAYLLDAIGRRRVTRGSDLISALLAAEEGGEHLDTAEIVSTCRLLLVAGNATTTDLIGNAVAALLAHPEERAKLATKPALLGHLVEEVLRYDPPVLKVTRVTTEATTIGGTRLEPGETVSASLLASGHDPAAYDDPHAFRIERDGRRHHALGGGAHFCLGASLGRAEAEIAIALLLERFPALRLADGLAPARKVSTSFGGFEALWLTA